MLLVLILGTCTQGCAAQATLNNHAQTPAFLPAVQAPAVAGLALPLPSQLHAVSDAQSIAKLGREYENSLPWNLVVADNDNARFSPDWAPGGGISGAAYAMYEFSLPGYTGEESLSLTWIETGGFAKAWLGLANFAHNRWDWFAMPAAAGNVSRLDIAFADYIQPGGGRMLVVPVFIDPAPATWLLSEVRIGAVPGQSWLHTWGGADDDAAYDAATDAAGNLYLTGVTDSFGTGSADLLLLKYSPDGALLWQKTWTGTEYDSGSAIKVDGSGEIYITGFASGFSPQGGLLILRLSSSGVLEWQKLYSMDGLSPGGNSIAVDAAGNVFVLGTFYSTDIVDDTYISQDDSVVLKLNPDGTMQWDSVWGGFHSDEISSIVPDQAGGCYAGGRSTNFIDNTPKLAVLKYGDNGQCAWAKTWSNGYSAGAFSMTLAPDGRLWFAGSAQQNSSSDRQGLLLALDLTGTDYNAWTLGGAYDDLLYGVAVATDGTVHAYGETYRTSVDPTDCDALYAVVDSGALVSAKAWGSAGVDEYFGGGALDSANAMCLGGIGKTPATGNWVDVAATYAAGVTGTLSAAGTSLKDLHGTLSDITGTLDDVTGIVDAETGDDKNVLACKP